MACLCDNEDRMIAKLVKYVWNNNIVFLLCPICISRGLTGNEVPTYHSLVSGLVLGDGGSIFCQRQRQIYSAIRSSGI